MTTKVERTICWRVSLCLVALVFLGSASLASCTPSPPPPTPKPPASDKPFDFLPLSDLIASMQ